MGIYSHHQSSVASPFPFFTCKSAAFFFGLAVSVFLFASVQGWEGGEGAGLMTSMQMRLACSVSLLVHARVGRGDAGGRGVISSMPTRLTCSVSKFCFRGHDCLDRDEDGEDDDDADADDHNHDGQENVDAPDSQDQDELISMMSVMITKLKLFFMLLIVHAEDTDGDDAKCPLLLLFLSYFLDAPNTTVSGFVALRTKASNAKL